MQPLVGAEWLITDVSNIFVHFPLVSLVQAQYWHDPTEEAEYVKKSLFMADVNQDQVGYHPDRGTTSWSFLNKYMYVLTYWPLGDLKEILD